MHKYQISRLIFALCVTICISLTTIAPAAIITTGDVDPGAPSGWTSSTTGYVGDDENGTMEITDGDDVTSRYGYIGHRPDSTSVVIIDGDGSAWVNSYSFYVGYFGNGTLEITDGGYVSNSTGYIGYYGYNSAGVVAVDGAGSKWVNSSSLYVGRYGDGTLTITNGGYVSSLIGYIGNRSGSTSEVIVDGSTWANSEHLYVGDEGAGTLNITNGGFVSNSYGFIGFDSGSAGAVTVDGAGSIWTNSSRLCVGYAGDGTLNITDGGYVSNDDYGRIGTYSDSTGVVTVDGAGSTWVNNDDLVVGRYGTGSLNITNGGLVSVVGGLTIDYDEDGDSFINMSTGGMLALYGDASDSLTEFLGLVSGTDAINYWDDSISDWADISGATNGVDYTLSAGDGDLVGYTVLTVPEPATMSLLALGGLAMIKRRRRKR